MSAADPHTTNKTRFRIVSWNVNGIRAWSQRQSAYSNLSQLFDSWEADIVCFQETKVTSLDGLDKLRHIDGWESFWSICTHVEGAVKMGYSGVVTYAREGMTESCSVREFDQEGRVIITDHGTFLLFNVYCPNSGRDRRRLDYKLKFFEWFRAKCDSFLKEGRSIIVVGDLNIAHTQLDYHPSLGPYGEKEVSWMDNFTAPNDGGFVDAFRKLHPQEVKYTWWDTVKNNRAVNIGLRLDYALVHQSLWHLVISCDVWQHVFGSDHCPIVLDLDRTRMEGLVKTDKRSPHSSQTALRRQPKISTLFAKIPPTSTQLDTNSSSSTQAPADSKNTSVTTNSQQITTNKKRKNPTPATAKPITSFFNVVSVSEQENGSEAPAKRLKTDG